MSTTTQASTRPTIRQLVEGLGAFVVLAAGLVGIPAVLATVIGWPLPHHLPRRCQVAGRVADPDPGLVLAPPLRLVGLAGLGLLRLLLSQPPWSPTCAGRGNRRAPARAPPRHLRARLRRHHRRRRPRPAPRRAGWTRQCRRAPAVAAPP